MGKQQYEERTRAYVLPIIEQLGLELVDVEFVREGKDDFLRIFIDKPGGVTIEDCVAVTEPMNTILDREDYIREAYTFEVSSPGLDRPLKKDADFQRNLGKKIEVKLYEPVDGKKELTGILEEFGKDDVYLSDGQTRIRIDRAKLALARPALEF